MIINKGKMEIIQTPLNRWKKGDLELEKIKTVITKGDEYLIAAIFVRSKVSDYMAFVHYSHKLGLEYFDPFVPQIRESINVRTLVLNQGRDLLAKAPIMIPIPMLQVLKDLRLLVDYKK